MLTCHQLCVGNIRQGAPETTTELAVSASPICKANFPWRLRAAWVCGYESNKSRYRDTPNLAKHPECTFGEVSSKRNQRIAVDDGIFILAVLPSSTDRTTLSMMAASSSCRKGFAKRGKDVVCPSGRSVYPLARMMGKPGRLTLISDASCKPVIPGIDWSVITRSIFASGESSSSAARAEEAQSEHDRDLRAWQPYPCQPRRRHPQPECSMSW